MNFCEIEIVSYLVASVFCKVNHRDKKDSTRIYGEKGRMITDVIFPKRSVRVVRLRPRRELGRPFTAKSALTRFIRTLFLTSDLSKQKG